MTINSLSLLGTSPVSSRLLRDVTVGEQRVRCNHPPNRFGRCIGEDLEAEDLMRCPPKRQRAQGLEAEDRPGLGPPGGARPAA